MKPGGEDPESTLVLVMVLSHLGGPSVPSHCPLASTLAGQPQAWDDLNPVLPQQGTLAKLARSGRSAERPSCIRWGQP